MTFGMMCNQDIGRFYFDLFFIFNGPAPAQISTLSLHDALPICAPCLFPKAYRSSRTAPASPSCLSPPDARLRHAPLKLPDRKSTRLNSSHSQISYAVFCLKKKTRHFNIAVDDSLRIFLLDRLGD